MRLLWNTDWRSAASFACFGLCTKQNRVMCLFVLIYDLYLVVERFFSNILFTFLISELGGMDLSFVAECH